MRSADYVVVGAGSSGCIVASRLAAAGASVVLLEAGGKDRSRIIRTPGLVAVMHSVPQIKKRFDWGFTTIPQKAALDRRIPQVRGKVVGGSSSINGMVFVRGNRQNFDDWAAAGCTGWGWDDVLPSYRRFEDWEFPYALVLGLGEAARYALNVGLENAQARAWEPSHSSPEVFLGLQESIGAELAVLDLGVEPGDPQARLRGPELIVRLHLIDGLEPAELDAVLQRLARRWAADDRIAVLVDSLTVKLVRG